MRETEAWRGKVRRLEVREVENEEKNFSLRQELMCTTSIGQKIINICQ